MSDFAANRQQIRTMHRQEGSVQHTGQLPFAFYEIKSEKQPSAQGATTRPEA